MHIDEISGMEKDNEADDSFSVKESMSFALTERACGRHVASSTTLFLPPSTAPLPPPV